ncbi:hypothetical protein EDD85DRAFT_950716 [Armillaria nabsnona]|nr:hypothetical protein EDD85DRAFT_950716 [Armillaria nabsnona]
MESHLSNTLTYVTETLFVWEYLISIDDEVALFWACFNFITLEGSRLSETLETVLKTIVDQILNRYLGMLLRIWDMFVYQYSLVQYICGINLAPSQPITAIQCVVLESIVVVRAWAILGRQQRVLWIFFGLLAFTTSASTVIGALSIERENGHRFYILPLAFFETTVSAAVAYRGIKYLRDSRSLRSSCADARPRPLVRLVFEDSILYFVMVAVILIVVPFSPATLPLGLSIASITVTRMLLRLRKQALSDSAGETSEELSTLTFRVRAVSGGISSSSKAEEDGSV